jgi:hypothetical protein
MASLNREGEAMPGPQNEGTIQVVDDDNELVRGRGSNMVDADNDAMNPRLRRPRRDPGLPQAR